MSDRGAEALAERAGPAFMGSAHYGDGCSTCLSMAEETLGTTGLFIADVTKHEPHIEQGIYPTDPTWIACSCGWNTDGEVDQPPEDGEGESYFDHIGGIG